MLILAIKHLAVNGSTIIIVIIIIIIIIIRQRGRQSKLFCETIYTVNHKKLDPFSFEQNQGRIWGGGSHGSYGSPPLGGQYCFFNCNSGFAKVERICKHYCYANLFTIDSRRVVPACNARLGMIARTRNINVLTY